MADKYTFSIENSLLDALGFLKKIGLTMFDAAIRPWKILQNTFNEIEYSHKKPYILYRTYYRASKDPTSIYVSHFLYFVIWTLLYLSYYKAFSFNRYNNIAIPAQDVIRETNSYLTSTTIAEKLLVYFPVVLVFYLVITGLSCVCSYFAAKVSNVSKKDASYLFRRMTYYIAATGLMLQLVPVILHNFIGSEPLEDLIGRYLRIGYWLWVLISIAYQVLQDGIVKEYKLEKSDTTKRIKQMIVIAVYVLLIMGLSFSIEFRGVRKGFNWYLESFGYLKHGRKITLLNLEGNTIQEKNNSITFHKVIVDTANANGVLLRTNLAIANAWPNNILLLNKETLKITFTTLDSCKVKVIGTTNVNFEIIQDLKVENELQGKSIPGGNEVTQLVLQSNNSINKDTLLNLEQSAIIGRLTVTAELNYLPFITHNRIVATGIKALFK